MEILWREKPRRWLVHLAVVFLLVKERLGQTFFAAFESGNLMWGNRIAMRVSAEVLRQPVGDLLL